MMNTSTSNQTVSVVGLFDTSNEAQNAIRELVDLGVGREEISLVSNSGRRSSDPSTTDAASHADHATADGTTVGENVGAGALVGGLGGLLIGLGALAIPGIGPVLAAGPIAAALAGAGFGALGGGVIAGLKHAGIPEEEADIYAEAVRRGGTILTVTTDHVRADDISDILNRAGAVDVDERGTEFRQQGWSKFDPNAGPFQEDDIEATRRTREVQPDTNSRVRVYPMQNRTAIGTSSDINFEDHYRTNYGTTGQSYDSYRPAYEYGYRSSQDERFRNRSFDESESEVRRDYESQYPHQPWESMKDAIRHGWDKMTGRRS